MSNEAKTAAAPSAAAAAAPSAAAPELLSTFVEAARKSMAEEHPQSKRAEEAAAIAAPEVEAGQESPPVKTAEEIAADEENARVAAEAAAAAEDAGAEPTAEELAGLSEGGRRALVRERQARKEAKAEVAELRTKLAELEAKVKPAPETTANTAATTPSVETTALGDCQTFEDVDARVMQAATTDAQVLNVRKTLAREGVDAAAAKLKALKITTINGMPLAEADENAITDFLDTVNEGTRMTQVQAAPRKTFIAQQYAAWNEAAKIMPDLNDMKSDFYKQVQHLVQSRPSLRSEAGWPLIAAKLVMGHQAFSAKAKPAAAARPAATAAAKPAPGASRNAAGAAVPANVTDAIRAKIAAGTATMAEVQQLTKLEIAA